ncbi:UNVERIFIED_CONTAM: hypothetical protein H355_001097 [Colinus virginianus]|nr:hypothetical protein H355_001097 [Colinus virginianus]
MLLQQLLLRAVAGGVYIVGGLPLLPPTSVEASFFHLCGCEDAGALAVQETFFDSAGYADVITTIFGGRNARCAAEFVRAKGTKTWAEIETEMLHGQKLQVRMQISTTSSERRTARKLTAALKTVSLYPAGSRCQTASSSSAG